MPWQLQCLIRSSPWIEWELMTSLLKAAFASWEILTDVELAITITPLNIPDGKHNIHSMGIYLLCRSPCVEITWVFIKSVFLCAPFSTKTHDATISSYIKLNSLIGIIKRNTFQVQFAFTALDGYYIYVVCTSPCVEIAQFFIKSVLIFSPSQPMCTLCIMLNFSWDQETSSPQIFLGFRSTSACSCLLSYWKDIEICQSLQVTPTPKHPFHLPRKRNNQTISVGRIWAGSGQLIKSGFRVSRLKVPRFFGIVIETCLTNQLLF